MAETPAPPAPPAAPGAPTNGGAAPSLQILGQYIKDLSFESPAAPQAQPPTGQPRFEIAVNVGARKLEDGIYAAEQTISVKAELEGQVLFNLELVYGGVFKVQNVLEERLYPLLMIDCQQLLFPFSRQTISSTIQNGGFPPILLQPVDFVALFRKNHPPKPAAEPVTETAAAGPAPGGKRQDKLN
ncbi:MAG TPA: protein-export chaperone SecB [Devosiaceae bacterium]|nr:protein-export chaperone SecB [Devosiaceae bacterium]